MAMMRLYATQEDFETLEKLGAFYNEDTNYFECEDSYSNRIKFAKWTKDDPKFYLNFDNTKNVSIKVGINIFKEIFKEMQRAKYKIYISNDEICKNRDILEALKDIKSKSQNLKIKIVSNVKNVDELKTLDTSLQQIYKYKIVDDMKKMYDRSSDVKRCKIEIQDSKNAYEQELYEIDNKLNEKANEILKVNTNITKNKMFSKRSQILFAIFLVIFAALAGFAYHKKEYNLAVFSLMALVVTCVALFAIFSSKKAASDGEYELEELTETEEDFQNEKQSIIMRNDEHLENLNKKLQNTQNRDIRSLVFESAFDLKILDTTVNGDRISDSKLNFILIDDTVYLGSFSMGEEDLFKSISTIIKVDDANFAYQITKYFEDYLTKFGLDFYEQSDITKEIYNEEQILLETLQ